MYSEEEINKIKSMIEPYKIFYQNTNNIYPLFLVISTIFGLIISVLLSSISSLFVFFIICFFLRLFIIFHDCCHNSFFEISKSEYQNNNFGLNKVFSYILGFFIWYDPKGWKEGHSTHHKTHGNSKLKDPARLVITLNEYNNMNIFYKLCYRIIRSPIFFFPLVSLHLFYVQNFINKRFIPVILIHLQLFFLYLYGGKNILKKVVLSIFIAATIGAILFHLQHHVNDGFYEEYDEHNLIEYERAALHGATYLQIPFFLKWVTFGIEYHHIHHLTPRIPGYNLKKCHDEVERKNPEIWNKINKVGYKKAFKSMFNTLYDEENKKYIPFPPLWKSNKKK